MTFEAGPVNPQPHAINLFTQPNDATTWLPEGAAGKLRALRQHLADLHAVCVPFEDRHAANIAKLEAVERLKRLQAHRSEGGFDLPEADARVIAAHDHLAKVTAEAQRLSELDAVRSAAWQAASHTLSAVQDWLRDGRPGGTALEDFAGPPPTLTKGESVVDAIERIRRRGRELKADLHRIRSAPYPSRHAKAQMRAQIEALAMQGAASVSRLVEHDGDIEFPTQQLRVTVHNAQPGAIGFVDVPDPVATLAWLHKDALIAALDREIAAEADDDAALTHEARQRQEADVLGDLLTCERDESWLVWTALAQSLPVFHRNDCSPLAILQCRLITAAAVNASPGSSSPHAYDVVNGGRRR